jgi:hypothetical protein
MNPVNIVVIYNSTSVSCLPVTLKGGYYRATELQNDMVSKAMHIIHSAPQLEFDIVSG